MLSSNNRATSKPVSLVDWNVNPEVFARISESRQEYLFPRVKGLLSLRHGGNLLDYGCGDGTLLGELVSQVEGGTWIGFEPSAPMRLLAENSCRDAGACVRILDSMSELTTREFDYVLNVAVWMTWRTSDECVQNLSAISRILKRSGRMIAAVTHPCFRETKFKHFRTDFSNSNYGVGGAQFSVFLEDGEETVILRDYHWNLNHMLSQLALAGMRCVALHEVTHPSEPQGGIPWLILEAEPVS